MFLIGAFLWIRVPINTNRFTDRRLQQWPGNYFTRENTSWKTAAVNIYNRIGDGRTHTSTDTAKGYERQNNNTASKCEFETTKTFKKILLQAIAMIVTNIMNEQGAEYDAGLLRYPL